MPNRALRLALAQINLSVGDFEGNSKKIIENIKRAYEKKADIVVFPELSVCGYPPEDLLLKPHFIKENEIFLKKIAVQTPEIIALVGLAYGKTGSVYNSCAIVCDKKITGYYHKRFLPNYAVFDEKRYFKEGEKPLIVSCDGIPAAVNICEDIWRENANSSFGSQMKKARLIINMSASPYYRGKMKARRKMLASRAKTDSAYIVYCNLVGAQDELVFDGGSLIFDASGRVVLQAPQFEEGIFFMDLDVSGQGQEPEINERFNLIKIFSAGKISKKPRIKRKNVELLKEEDEVYKALKLGLGDYVGKNHFKKVVLGLSGGIDSALCAVIAVDTLGKNNVLAVIMPSEFTSFSTLNDAIMLAKRLGIEFFVSPINSMYRLYLQSLESVFKGRKKDVTEENIQARVRGNILMAISNKFGYLVLTTGNKSETSVGYCTLYGDMAGGFAVLKDVPKTLVYKLAKHRNSLQKENVIPPSIIKRPPSAELRINQTDQDTLPSYDTLDKILKLYIEEDRSLQQIIQAGFDKKTVKHVITMVDRNEYKRRQASPGVKITPRAFGKDRRMPISNQYIVK